MSRKIPASEYTTYDKYIGDSLTDADGLKPCPFCGGKAVYNEFEYRGERKCAIVCSNSDCRCSAIHTFHIWRDKQSAIKAWNTRVTYEGVDS